MLDLKRQGHILYISSVDVSLGNGPGVNEREFILGLHRAIGDRAHFLIPRPASPVAELPLEACTFARPHGRHSPHMFPGHVASQIRLADKLLAQRHFDLLVFRLDILPIAPFYITRRHGVPYVLKTLGQGMVNILGEKGGVLGKALLGFNRQLTSRLVERALVADSVSQLQVEYLQRLLGLGAGSVVWIDNAANTERFYPADAREARRAVGLDAFDPVIGYVGNLPWERGARQLIEALPLLRTTYPQIGGLVLGGGAGLAELQELAQRLGVADRCRFTGAVPFDQVPQYVNAIDVGLSISLRADRQASSELKVRQYLACGKPVVASPGSNDFLAGEQLGTIVPPTDLAAISAAIDGWLRLGAPAREAFAQRASGFVRDRLSMGAAIDRRLELWSERLQPKGPRLAFDSRSA